MTTITKYYKISKMLNDDIYLIANTLKNISTEEILFSKLLKHLEALKLDDYEHLINECFIMELNEIVEASRGLSFSSEASYIIYLQGLLKMENIAYSKFVKKSSAQGVLF